MAGREFATARTRKRPPASGGGEQRGTHGSSTLQNDVSPHPPSATNPVQGCIRRTWRDGAGSLRGNLHPHPRIGASNH